VNGRETEMIVKVLVEGCNAATSFDLTVRAGSISRTVCIVSRHYYGSDTGMKFPIMRFSSATTSLLGQG
jgi:hypothetical protein